MKDHTPVELAYAAGFFDGEGSLSIIRHRPSSRPSSRKEGRDLFKVSLIVANNNRAVLESLQAEFAGRIYRNAFKTKPAHWRPSYQWHLWGNECEHFCIAVRPYMRIKGVLVDSALEFYALQRQRGHKRETAPDIWERMKELHRTHRVLVQEGSAPRRTRYAAVAVAEVAPVPEMEVRGNEESVQLNLPDGP